MNPATATGIEITWGIEVLKRLQDAAGCPEIGCKLRYLGESESSPSHLFRHEAYRSDQVIGGDIRIGNYRMNQEKASEIAKLIVKKLREHHDAARTMGAIAWDEGWGSAS